MSCKVRILVSRSTRLVFNAKTDHIIISGRDSVNLKSPAAVNIDTSKVIVNSGAIFLGDKDAEEPILLGDQTVEVLADADRNTSEPHKSELKADDKEAEDKSDELDTDGEVPMLDKDFDDEDEMGEEVELQAPVEDKFTNDLDPAEKK